MALFTKDKSAPRAETPMSAAVVAQGDAGQPVAPDDAALEELIKQIGREFLDQARRHRLSVLSSAFWSDKLIDWAMKDEAFKVQLFRFVDAFPTLKTPRQIHDHLVDYLSQPGVTPPPGLGLGIKAGGLMKGMMAKTVAGQITAMAQKFIAGTDAASAQPMLKDLWSRGIGFSVDLLGEVCVSHAEACDYQRKYLDLVRNLSREVARWPANDRLEHDHLGPVPRTNVSIKISSLYARTDPIDFAGTIGG
ncbi:MAG: hypothetical protein O6941_07290 [Planctomycetota bacterium]|nr:hypothetical protein [Planctomycetota bacterium]